MKRDKVSLIKVRVQNRKTRKNLLKQRFKNNRFHRLKMLFWVLKTLYLTSTQFQTQLIASIRNTTQVSKTIIRIQILHRFGLNKLHSCNKPEMVKLNREIIFHQVDMLVNNFTIIVMKLRTWVKLIKWIRSYLQKAISINRNNFISKDMRIIKNIKQTSKEQFNNLNKIKQ